MTFLYLKVTRNPSMDNCFGHYEESLKKSFNEYLKEVENSVADESELVYI